MGSWVSHLYPGTHGVNNEVAKPERNISADKPQSLGPDDKACRL